MPVDCGVLFGIRERIVEKLENVNSSIDGINQNLTGAEIALAGAVAAAGSCYWAGPAVVQCLVAAGVVAAAAAAAVAYYQSQLNEALAARDAAQNALDEVDALLSHCQALQSWQQEAADALADQAPDADGLPDAPDGDDSSMLDEAEGALAELEAMGEGGDDSYA